MSMETHVFFRGPLPRKRALQGAMKGLGFPFRLSPATGRLEDQDGYMPMRFRREDTGVEFDVFDGREAVDEFADIDPAFDRVANFRWGSDLVEAAAGQCGAAALAKLVGGVVFDEAEDMLLSVDEAAEVARRTIAAIPPPVLKKQGTRQTDIKRYLKPLLDMRPDLVLTGRLLLIQPVRHLLRGAWFESSMDRTSFYVNWFVQPLAGGPWLHDRVGSLNVDHPQFLPLFHHCLCKHVFERVGQITTLDAYRNPRGWRRASPSNYVAPVFLTEGLEAAKELVARRPGYDEPETVDRFHALCEAGTDALLQHYRGKEADTVGELKITDGWDQAPFPFEVSSKERDMLTAESVFRTEPWVRFDPDWRAEMPSSPGEVRYADSVWYESGEYFLIGPMSPEEARQRGGDHQSYAFAKRLEDGALVVLRRLAHSEDWLASLPETAPARLHPRYWGQYLEIDYPGGLSLSCDFSDHWVDEGRICLGSVHIHGTMRKELWSAVLFDHSSKLSIRDERGDTVRLSERKLDDEELAAVTLADPDFDSYEPMLDCVTAFLARYGYGALE